MTLYWSYNSIPELEDLPEETRKEVWKECRMSDRTPWRTFLLNTILGTIMFLCIAAGTAFGKFYYGRIGGITGGITIAVITGSVCGFIIAQLHIARVRPRIREYLCSHGKTNQQSM